MAVLFVTAWCDYVAITAVTVAKNKTGSWSFGCGGGECHSKFSVYPEISVLWIAAFSFDHRRCCRSPIHRWIIPPKSPKSLILFISTPHKKGALFPLLSLYSMVVSSSGFPTSVRTGTSCSNISDWVGFEGILIDVDRDPFYTDANKH